MKSPVVRSAVVITAAACIFGYIAGCASGPDGVQQAAEIQENDTGQPADIQQNDPDEPRPDPDFDDPPEDYLDAEIVGVVAVPGQQPAVLLGSEAGQEDAQEAILPIFISYSQAMAIQLGLEDRDFERPLTHDVLHDIMDRLDGQLEKVQVDELRGGTFYATIFMTTPTEVVEIDARPSDALALSTGIDVPIYVAEQVMEQAGLTEEDVEQMPPADPGEPEDYDDAPTTPM